MTGIAVENLEQEVRSLIAEIAEVGEEKITPDTHFVKDLGMDSMMALEILAATEKKYQLRIPEGYLARMTNLAQVVSIVKDLLSKK